MTEKKFTKEFFQEAGRKGGKRTFEKYGKEHMEKIARKKRPRKTGFLAELFLHGYQQKLVLRNVYTSWKALSWFIPVSFVLIGFLYVEYKSDIMITRDEGDVPLAMNRASNKDESPMTQWCNGMVGTSKECT